MHHPSWWQHHLSIVTAEKRMQRHMYGCGRLFNAPYVQTSRAVWVRLTHQLNLLDYTLMAWRSMVITDRQATYAAAITREWRACMGGLATIHYSHTQVTWLFVLSHDRFVLSSIHWHSARPYMQIAQRWWHTCTIHHTGICLWVTFLALSRFCSVYCSFKALFDV